MRFKKGDIVTVKKPVEGYYSGYGGKPHFQFTPLNIGTVKHIAPKVRGRGDFLVVDFISSTTGQEERVGIDPSNAVKVKERKMAMKNPTSGPADEAAARELVLFIENDGDLYRQQGLPIIKNLVAKVDRGIYNRELAIKLYLYYMESGAKAYAREFSGTWNEIFTKPTRELAAKNFVAHFEEEYKLGNYDHLHAKKYAGKMGVMNNPYKKYSKKHISEIVKLKQKKISDFSKSAKYEIANGIANEGRKRYLSDTLKEMKQDLEYWKKGMMNNPKQRELSVPEKHQLKIARDTLRMSDVGARIMGGMTKEEAREIIYRFTGKVSSNPKQRSLAPTSFTIEVYAKGQWHLVQEVHGGLNHAKSVMLKLASMYPSKKFRVRGSAIRIKNNPVGRVTKYKGYTIVEQYTGAFSIYKNGVELDREHSLKSAKRFIDKYLNRP